MPLPVGHSRQNSVDRGPAWPFFLPDQVHLHQPLDGVDDGRSPPPRLLGDGLQGRKALVVIVYVQRQDDKDWQGGAAHLGDQAITEGDGELDPGLPLIDLEPLARGPDDLASRLDLDGRPFEHG